jgi:glycosyltransferase involved in cell wall biosynthesis
MRCSQESLSAGISVVVPVFNSAGFLSGLVKRIEAVVAELCTDFEVILVNDGSRDRSWEEICELSRQAPHVRGIHLMRNFGQHNAVLCGVRAARYSVIVTLDDDGQNPPEEIPKLIHRLSEGYDIVYALPENQSHSSWRNLSSRATKLVMRTLLGARIGAYASPFRAFHTRLRKAFAEHQNAHVAMDVLLEWGTARKAVVKVRHAAREHGRSNYTLGRLVAHTVNMIAGVGLLPVRLASVVGCLCATLGLILLGYGLFETRAGDLGAGAVPALAGFLAVLFGIQLFVLGMIGEYMARLHLSSLNKPAYVIAEEVTAEDHLLTTSEDWSPALKRI